MKNDTPFLVKTAALLANPKARIAHIVDAERRRAESIERTAAFWDAETRARLAPIERMVSESRYQYDRLHGEARRHRAA